MLLVIPTLFLPDPDDRRFVVPIVREGCEWVLAGEGVARRQYDGIVALFDPAAPHLEEGGEPELHGWFVEETATDLVPAWRSRFAAPMLAAARNLPVSNPPTPGTHELIGPGIRRNAERVPRNVLIAHRDADLVDAPRDFEGLRRWLLARQYKGVVFHHPDGRMAKLRRRDVRR